MYRELVSHLRHLSRRVLLRGQPCGTQIVADPVDTVSLLKTQKKTQEKILGLRIPSMTRFLGNDHAGNTG